MNGTRGHRTISSSHTTMSCLLFYVWKKKLFLKNPLDCVEFFLQSEQLPIKRPCVRLGFPLMTLCSILTLLFRGRWNILWPKGRISTKGTYGFITHLVEIWIIPLLKYYINFFAILRWRKQIYTWRELLCSLSFLLIETKNIAKTSINKGVGMNFTQLWFQRISWAFYELFAGRKN